VSQTASANQATPEPARPAAPVPASGGARPEFTVRAVVVGVLVALLIGAAYPYVVLKIGFGPNMSVVAAFFGFMAISVAGRLLAPRGNRYEYNIVQTAGTAAGQQGFMVIVLAAFDLLASRGGVKIELTTLQIFLWLTLGGALGVLLAVPLRKHYIDEENLTFADGTAAGETLILLDSDYRTARKGVLALLVGGITSGTHAIFSQFVRIFPEGWFPGAWATKLHVGTSWSILSVASGMLVGLRVTLSMGLGMVLGWYLAPPLLFGQGIISDQALRPNLQWVMWPAVGLMVSGGLTTLFLKWKLIVKTFRELKVSSVSGTDFPIKWVAIGSVVFAVALVVMQKVSLGLAPWLSILAILVSIPLMLVGTRVLGETNWAPISSMANVVQVIFAGIAPGNASVNMITSGMSGTVAANGEHLMQDYKAGKLIGSNNRYLTYMQLLALPFGAIAVAWIYPILRAQYGIGPDRYGLDPAHAAADGQGLIAPASIRWAGFAEVLAKGLDSLPKYALAAFAISLAVGVVLALLEGATKSKWVPSATSVGLGILIEPQYVMAMVLGGVIQALWAWRNAKQEGEVGLALASGAIVGEALAVLLMTILAFFGLISTPEGDPLIPAGVWAVVFVALVGGALWYAGTLPSAREKPAPARSGGH
jgi:putative OPT family oligopeptide transporter